jgi:hypothetical protein
MRDLKTEATTQLGLAGVHFYAGVLAAIAFVIHIAACKYHLDRWGDAR